MAEEPEVIQHELEETRHALAEKLGQIGDKISGTVENVTDTVESVTSVVENTVEAVTGTVESVGETAQQTVEAVKDAFNVPEQVRKYPWLWFGGSVLVGFLGGKMLIPPGRPQMSYDSAFPSQGNGYPARAADERRAEPPASSSGQGYAAGATQSTAAQQPSWLSQLAERFAPDLNQLKTLALGTLFGVARDMVTQSMPPSIKSDLVNVFDNITETVGGKPIRGEVFPEESHSEFTQTKGGPDEKSDPTEMDRPMGAAERKGKTGMGKTQRR